MSEQADVVRELIAPGSGVGVRLPVVSATVPGARPAESETRAAMAPAVDWRRLAVWATIALVVIFSLATAVLALRGTEYGFDFRGIWRAGGALLAGHPIYPAATRHALEYPGNALVAPPVLAVLGAPISLLPFWAAVAVWNLVCVTGLVAGLRLVGIRDGRILVLAAGSFPAVSSFVLGQPEGMFVLLGAVAWRQRGRDAGALAVGVLIALKLLAWPLLIWLLVTRRYRGAAVAAGSAVALTGGSWALAGFDGLRHYLGLLGRDASVFAARSHSLVALALHLGASQTVATAVLVIGALAASAVVLLSGRASDHAWFGATLLAGLLSSPVVWAHYLLVLVLPIATARRQAISVWLAFAAGFWISPTEQGDAAQIAATLLLAVVLVVAVAHQERPGPDARAQAAAIAACG